MFCASSKPLLSITAPGSLVEGLEASSITSVFGKVVEVEEDCDVVVVV